MKHFEEKKEKNATKSTKKKCCSLLATAALLTCLVNINKPVLIVPGIVLVYRDYKTGHEFIIY